MRRVWGPCGAAAAAPRRPPGLAARPNHRPSSPPAAAAGAWSAGACCPMHHTTSHTLPYWSYAVVRAAWWAAATRPTRSTGPGPLAHPAHWRPSPPLSALPAYVCGGRGRCRASLSTAPCAPLPPVPPTPPPPHPPPPSCAALCASLRS